MENIIMTKVLSSHSSDLFVKPSFVRGMAKAMDFGNTLERYNRSPDAQSADYKAIYSDWYQVGSDINNAMKEYANG